MIKKVMESQIQSTIKSIIGQIAVAQKASPLGQSVKLIAVSKTKAVEIIQEAYDGGQRDFGENYVHEIEAKAPLLPQDINWHFIGHLQSNKISKVMVDNLHCIQTVDSQKLAGKLQTSCKAKDRNLNVMVQLSTSDEDTKNGLDLPEALEVVNFIRTECDRLRFTGFMTIGKSGDLTSFEVNIGFLLKNLENENSQTDRSGKFRTESCGRRAKHGDDR
jgi:pyridoxal phosphate enzyme (YggS family)